MLFLILLILIVAVMFLSDDVAVGLLYLFVGILVFMFPFLGIPVAGLIFYFNGTSRYGSAKSVAQDNKRRQANYERKQARNGLPATPKKHYPVIPANAKDLPWAIHPDDDWVPESLQGFNKWKHDL